MKNGKEAISRSESKASENAKGVSEETREAEVAKSETGTENDKVYFFDTTLRDGEQAAGVNLNAEEKLQIAKQLAKMGMDVIEAGFPASSPGDFNCVQTIAREVKKSVICGLARTREGDIRAAAQALEPSLNARIHVFIASSPIHMEYKLKMSEGEVLDQARSGVLLARSFVRDVEFSAEDASRSDIGFLIKLFKTAVDAGASVLNIPDTVGYALPRSEEHTSELQSPS
jgi:2-isopropylmalate synthase